jgi:hypothetical protein
MQNLHGEKINGGGRQLCNLRVNFSGIQMLAGWSLPREGKWVEGI